jgi:hypothetical protein
MSAEDMRKNLAILENIQDTGEPINEALPMNLWQAIKTAGKSIIDDLAAGELEVGQAANRLYVEYRKYLGKIKTTPGTETVGDLYDFLVHNRISDATIFAGLKALGAPIASKADIEKYWNTVIQIDYKNKIGKVFMAIASSAKKLPAKDMDPELFAARERKAAQMAATARAKEMNEPPTGEPTGPEGSPTPPPGLDLTPKEVAALLKALSGT